MRSIKRDCRSCVHALPMMPSGPRNPRSSKGKFEHDFVAQGVDQLVCLGMDANQRVRREHGRPRIQDHRFGRRVSRNALPALGVLQHPFDQLALIADDQRLGAGAARDVVMNLKGCNSIDRW